MISSRTRLFRICNFTLSSHEQTEILILDLVILSISLAFIFGFINGFHNASNSISTLVSTRTMSATTSIIWAVFFSFISIAILKLNIATTIGKGIVRVEEINQFVILSGISAAIIWNLFTWYLGIPSSASHTLIGGFVGAAIAKAGIFSVIFSGLFKIFLFILIAPFASTVLSIVITVMVLKICSRFRYDSVNRGLRRLQLGTSAAFNISHGANDAQKIIGIMFVATIAGQKSDHDFIPVEVSALGLLSIALGTLTGGWRIVKTMGMKITNIQPYKGVSAELASAITLFSTAILGIPVSTTHTITGAIMGTGFADGKSKARWGVILPIIWTWVLTIPISALLGSIIYFILLAIRSL